MDAADRANAGAEARRFFEDLWREGDHWDLETSDYDQARYDRELALLGGRRYRRALEIGSGEGALTRRLAEIADSVLAVEVAETAVERARARQLDGVEFRVANIMELEVEEEGPFDLVVFGETIYYLGWLYSFYEVGWLAWRLYGATELGGHLLLANTVLSDTKGLESPWLIRTYRDLFANVGYELEREEMFRAEKGGAEMEALLSLFTRPRPS